MLSGKLVYCAVCDSKKAWDAPIPDPLCRQWNKWESELPGKVEIPRSLAVHREPVWNNLQLAEKL